MSNKYYDYSFFLENINKKYANINSQKSNSTTNIDEINKNYDLYNSFYNSNKIFHYNLNLPEKIAENVNNPNNTPEETIDPENEDADKYKPETYACCMKYSSTLTCKQTHKRNKKEKKTRIKDYYTSITTCHKEKSLRKNKNQLLDRLAGFN